MFNKEKRQEKRERRQLVKEDLESKIKPRLTYEQLQASKAKRRSREEKSADRELAISQHLRDIHAGTATGDIAQIGADLLYLASLSNIQIDIHDQLSKSDKCFTRWTAYGRHEKEFLGMAPTGRQVRFGGMTVSFLDEFEQITQEAHYWDMAALLQQIQAP